LAVGLLAKENTEIYTWFLDRAKINVGQYIIEYIAWYIIQLVEKSEIIGESLPESICNHF
jgi:hypothetical protein